MMVTRRGSLGPSRDEWRWVKVPQPTVYFWIVLILVTGAGESMADFLIGSPALDGTGPLYAVGALFAGVLWFQIRSPRYVPEIYWSAVVLASIVNTLVADSLPGGFGISLARAAVTFGGALITTFSTWYLSEKTLSVNDIITIRQEIFYWLTVMFAFALGTETGDIVSRDLGLGYGATTLLFAGLVSLVTAARSRFGLDAVVTFWIVYVLARPLGVCLGDAVSHPRGDGGLELGFFNTSIAFLSLVLGLMLCLGTPRGDETLL